MPILYQIFIPLFSLFLVRVDLTDLFPMNIPVVLMEIMDGDTLSVRGGMGPMRIRLSKVDAPEKSQPFHTSGLDAGAASIHCLKRIIQNKKKMTLSIDGLDMYGRVLGNLDDLNFLIIREGCAGLYPHAKFKSVREKHKYLRAMFNAKKMKRGVWAYGGYQLPKIYRKLSKRNGHRQWHPRDRSLAPYRLARKLVRKGDSPEHQQNL